MRNAKPGNHLKYLGVLMDSNLCWKYHLSHLSKISSNIGMIARLRHFTPFVTLFNIYRSLISPSISYGLIAWGQAAKTHVNKILLLQKRVVRLMNFAKFSVHAVPLFISTNILPLPSLSFKNYSFLIHDVYNKVVPSNISDLFTPTKDVHHYNNRSSTAGDFYINYSRLNHYKNSFSIMDAKIWNSNPNVMRQLSKYRFKKKITEYLFQIFLKQDSYVDIVTLINEMTRT